jgi:hypothetical protein
VAETPAAGVRRHAWLAAAMTAPMALMPAVLAWQAWAGADRLATWAGAGVAALAMAGTVAGIDALMGRHGA